MGRIIGIDLGTTKCCVTVMQDGVPKVILNQEGQRTTPSVVGFAPDGQPLVGEVAKERARANPESTVFGITRLIGRRFGSPEVRESRRFVPYRLVQGRNGDAHVQIGDRVYTPAEILSFVLRKLKGAAEACLGGPIEDAVITVPAHSGRTERQVIGEACLMAGLRVSRLIGGSTAAALALALEDPDASGQFVAVYDLGGGTFDITMLDMAESLFQVRAASGDTYLGGEDFDHRIVDWLIGEFQGETGIDLSLDGMALQRLKEAAETAKCELSTVEKTEIVLPFISAEASGPKHLNTVLTRQRYEELTAELLERALHACERCLADAGLKPEQIDKVLLVGGQTRAPNVCRSVREFFGRERSRTLNPDEHAAIGAAILGGIMLGEVKDLVVLDVAPHTLGIETKGGTFSQLIGRNSTIPTRRSRLFTTVADYQTRVEVHVLEGESEVVARNNSLARFELQIPAAKGALEIEVTFEIDANGTLRVGAQDETSGRTESRVIDAVQQRGGGAGSQASVLHPTRGLVAVPVTPHTIGVEATNGTFVPLIPRYTRLPVLVRRLVSTRAGPEGLTVHILQGESGLVEYDRSLVRLEFPNEPTGAREQAEIEVAFDIDVNGTVSVCAQDRATGSIRSAMIGPSGRVAYDPRLQHLGQRGETGLYAFEVEGLPPEARATNPLVEQFRRGGVARDLRLMAAQGVLPLKPGDLVELWTHLLHDADERVRSAADKSLSSFEMRGTSRLDEVEEAAPRAPEPAAAAEAEPETAPVGDVFLTEHEYTVEMLSEEERQQTEKLSAVQKIYQLNTAEKLLMALKGSREERALLIRDPNPLVATCVLGSPKVTEAEIDSFSAMKSVSDHVLQAIGNHREWTKRYTVINNLVRNPRTPLALALRLVPRLGPRDVTAISRDWSVPEALRKALLKSPDDTPERQWREHEAKDRAEAVAVHRQLDGLVTNTIRALQALEAKLSPEERQRIYDAIEQAKNLRPRPDADLSELKKALAEMEKAAGIIGEAMLRP